MELIIKEAGARLDKALADLTDLSRSQANDEIKKGTVLVNGKAVKAKYAVKVGDVVTYEVPEEEVLEYTAENIPLDIVYEDEDVAVVYKPQGMVVHPSVGHIKNIRAITGINKILRIIKVLILFLSKSNCWRIFQVIHHKTFLLLKDSCYLT